jgi:antitoxin (DNA-binding transcriptional repressor) of toxin-antitoxin stability system
MYDLRMTTFSSSEARAALPELLDRVTAGEEVTITRHGKPVAVMVRPDSLRLRRADIGRALRSVQDLLESSRSTILPADEGLSSERAEELIADVRSGRARD